MFVDIEGLCLERLDSHHLTIHPRLNIGYALAQSQCAGVIYTDLATAARRRRRYEVCEGQRFEATVLEYAFGGHDISEVLASGSPTPQGSSVMEA